MQIYTVYIFIFITGTERHISAGRCQCFSPVFICDLYVNYSNTHTAVVPKQRPPLLDSALVDTI